MSLNIITDIEKVDKSKFIWDVESIGCIIPDNDYCKRVVKSIDKGEYLNRNSFIDRFGYKLYSNNLSTTSKAYLCLDRFPDKIINFIEVGKGTGDFLLEKNTGNIYITGSRLKTLFSSLPDKNIDVFCDNIRFRSYFNLVDYLEEEY